MTVTAVAADVAAKLLVERFAAADSNGIWELLEAADAHQQHQQAVGAQQHPVKVYNPFVSEEQLSDVALQITSLPDRVQQLPEVPQPLQPQAFVQHVLQQAIGYIAQQAAAVAAGSHAASSSEVVPGAVALSAMLLQKFITRGQAGPVAAAVLQLASAPQAAAAQESSPSAAPQAGGNQRQQHHHLQLLALERVLLKLSVQHTAATGKLLLQLLKIASVEHQHQQQLQALLCPLLISSPKLRSIASSKLLLSRTLSTASLDLLLQLLDSCQPSILPEAAVHLAQSWSDKVTIQHAPVQQQAFMTAALTACIQRLHSDILDPATAPVAQTQTAQPATAAAAGRGEGLLQGVYDQSRYQGAEPQQLSLLLPAILQGVSSRLASPSPAIRAQAMRVGRAFSVKLDPAKPLFEEAGELGLMLEEIWPEALGAKGVATFQQQQQQKDASSPADKDDGRSTTSSSTTNPGNSNSSKYEALNRLHEALASPEPDSDDEHDTAAAINSKSAAAAHGAMQPQNPQAGFSSPAAANGTYKSTISNNRAEGSDADADDSDDALSEGSVSSLVAFDLAEDLSAESWWGPDGLGIPEGESLSLRGLAAAVRKQDDGEAVLNALAKVRVCSIS